jgi:hypothetical protein
VKASALYRADQHSYLLYPDRRLPEFVERNNIPPGELRRSALLQALLADGNRQLIERDVAGVVHFHPTVTNARDLRRILETLPPSYARLVRRDASRVLDLFERLFDHESFTGRSGTFFGYEGLGCIYWHMVSKWLLAAQEAFFRALAAGAPQPVLDGLARHYYDIRAGIGDYKTPAVYGAFPMDPYSHTPGQGGARQPGLTGQVKEDILCRWGELGLVVEGGQICFRTQLLRRAEFAEDRSEFRYFDCRGIERRRRLPPRALAFTYCQTPFIYRLANGSSVAAVRANGHIQRMNELRLDCRTSREIFDRTGAIARVELALQF